MKFLFDLLARSPLWAIRPEVAPLALSVLRLGLREGKVSDSLSAVVSSDGRTIEVIKWEAAKPSIRGNGQDKIAVIPIRGVLTKDGPGWYGSSYDGIGQAVEAATADKDVKHIVLSVDSPGGEVTGTTETGALIARAAKVKPVTAMIDGSSASAAYWLSSQANRIVLTPSGQVGSIGVRMMHMDFSKMLDDEGIKVTELYSGDFKTEWSPFKSLSDEAKADMMPRLTAMHQDFINAVQAGRGERLTQDIRERRIGEGRMFSAADALSHGLVDAVQSSHDFFKALIPQQESASAILPIHLKQQRRDVEMASQV